MDPWLRNRYGGTGGEQLRPRRSDRGPAVRPSRRQERDVDRLLRGVGRERALRRLGRFLLVGAGVGLLVGAAFWLVFVAPALGVSR